MYFLLGAFDSFHTSVIDSRAIFKLLISLFHFLTTIPHLPSPLLLFREDQVIGVHRGFGSDDFHQGSFGPFEIRSPFVFDARATGDRRGPPRRRDPTLVSIPLGQNRGPSSRRTRGFAGAEGSHRVYAVSPGGRVRDLEGFGYVCPAPPRQKKF